MSELSAEAAILHAVIEGDLEEARRRIAGLLPGERRDLINQAQLLADLVQERDQLMNVIKDICHWARKCPHSIIGYYTHRGSHYGICACHKPEAQDCDVVVHDLPQEVKL